MAGNTKTPRSKQKRVARLDKIMDDMKRHQRMDEEATQEPSGPTSMLMEKMKIEGDSGGGTWWNTWLAISLMDCGVICILAEMLLFFVWECRDMVTSASLRCEEGGIICRWWQLAILQMWSLCPTPFFWFLKSLKPIFDFGMHSVPVFFLHFVFFFVFVISSTLYHSLSGLSTYGLKGQCVGDEHPACASGHVPLYCLLLWGDSSPVEPYLAACWVAQWVWPSRVEQLQGLREVKFDPFKQIIMCSHAAVWHIQEQFRPEYSHLN